MTARLGSAPLVKAKRDELAAAGRGSVVGFIASLIPFALAFAVYLIVFQEMRPGATGDEPHYLVTAQSIAYDLDVDLRNNYRNRDRVLSIVNVFPLGPHAAVYKDSGELRPIRSVGLPAVLAPAVRLGGLTGARLVLVLIAALVAAQLYSLLRDLRLPLLYRLAAWVAVVFCLPVIVFTSQVYPELAGALLVLIAVRVMVVGAARPAALALGAAAAAALPWLHVRYLPLSVSIVAGLAIAACLQGWKRGDRRLVDAARAFVGRSASVLRNRWRTVTLPIVAPYAIGIGLLAAAYERWYGSPNLQVSYGAYGSPAVGTGRWDFWYHFAIRDILDPVVGWIPFAPVHWLGFAALGCLVAWFGWRAAWVVAGAAGYLLVVASVGPGVGFGLPARYPMIIVPLIAVPLALGIQRVRVARLLFVPLLALSLIFAVAGIRSYGLLYPSDVQHVSGIRSIATAFPSLAGVQAAQAFTVTPGGPPAPETGKRERGEVVARAGRDKPGFVMFGPYIPLKAGAYQATFSLAARGVGPTQDVAIVEVVGAPNAVLAREVVTGGELRQRLTDITLTFANSGSHLLETRIYFVGRGVLRAGPARVQAIAVPEARVHYRDWPLVFLWVAGTFLVGWLFVEVMRSRRPSTRI